MAVDYEWDSFSEELEIRQTLSQGLRPLIERKYLAGGIDYDELREYIEDWAAARLASDEDE